MNMNPNDKPKLRYPIVGTNMTRFFGPRGEISRPEPGEPFYGQDAQYPKLQPAYEDNGDGTVLDLNTDLMWQKTTDAKPDSLEGRVTWYEAGDYSARLRLGGHDDWRVPSIKELISLVDANGTMTPRRAYFDSRYFDLTYGPATIDGYRAIDSQLVTTTSYISKSVLFSDWWQDFGKKQIRPGVMHIAPTFFGYNFTDGRIKSYPKENHPYNGLQTWCIRCVRGPVYGVNNFVDNGDGTISDRATGLMWQKTDDGKGRNWQEALDYCEHLELAGYDDWRLPDQKELHSIVDYDFIPAINPIFHISDAKAWFWSSTPFIDLPGQAVYLAFGKATGKTSASPEDEYDVHGAGAMRSDPMVGDPACYREGAGPQKDTIRIYNSVRAVRTLDAPRPPRHHL
jgi:hypothetical protein